MKRMIMMLGAAMMAIFSVSAQQHGEIKTVGNAAFKKAIQSSDVQLVDVRTPAEFVEGHICCVNGLVNMDVKGADFDNMIQTLDKNKKVAVYCKGGRRSLAAAEKLVKNGFAVINLKNGYSKWNGARCVDIQ